MRVLLASSASYDPPRGGSTHSNLAWLRELSARGHECEVVAGTEPPAHNPAVQKERLRRRIDEWSPDVVLVSSEDLSHILLREAHRSAPGRVVYVAHTPQFFPFGPESWNPDPQAAQLVQRSAAVVAIGHHMAGYIERAIGVRAHVIHPPIYGRPPFPQSTGGEFVTMINPSAVKGIGIFLAAARALPRIRFAALPGWATNDADRTALAGLSNVTLLEPVAHIDELLRRTRILLMPSLWYEGFGLIVMEAMLRGIPVIASDSGGLKEAKAGTAYVIPVRPIEGYERAWDERHMPRAIVPAQDTKPWIQAVALLAGDPAAWARESEASRAAAGAFLAAQRPNALEELLLSLEPATPAAKPAGGTAALTADKRELLLRRLHRMKHR